MPLTDPPEPLPSFARALGVLGPSTEEAIQALLLPTQQSLFEGEVPPERDHQTLLALIRVLIDPENQWSEQEATALLQACAARRNSGKPLDFAAVIRWVINHPNDASAVIQCLEVDPPDEVEIIRVLSRAGSQKVVYLASWRSMQREVVLKRVLRPDGTAVREMESFPLNLSHANIIKTHPLRNYRGELFFAEERLGEVLTDDWRARGLHDGANLLYDIASALKYLHEHKRVHGDVKPDNIGRNAGRYILLDFGICRPTDEFKGDVTATGSLRTRAPELLKDEGYIDPPRVDVWALGATIFNAYSGRFPLISADQVVPRISAPAERSAFEKLLRQRVDKEWDKWVNLSCLPEALREVVGRMLELDPNKRADCAEVLSTAEKELPAFIRSETQPGLRFSPIEELTQLSDFLATTKRELLPLHKVAEFTGILRNLQGTPGFSDRDHSKVQELLSSLAA